MKILTTTQAAALLGVHPKSVARMLENKNVSYVMVGHARAYDAATIEKLASDRAAAQKRAAAMKMIRRFRKETT
jgi:excisionase family DNA binding protein